MLKFELFPDGDVHVSLGWNGGDVLHRGRWYFRLCLRRRRRYLVGTEALLDGLVLVFDAARAWKDKTAFIGTDKTAFIALFFIAFWHLPSSSSTCNGVTDATLTTKERISCPKGKDRLR